MFSNMHSAYQSTEELMTDFLNTYDDYEDNCGSQSMSVIDFLESWKYGILTPDDGTPYYIVNGEVSNINAFINVQLPSNCDGVCWYAK